MNDFLRLQELAASDRRRRIFMLTLIGLVLLFGIATCVSVRKALDCDCGTSHSDTAHVTVAGKTAPYKPVPSSITYPGDSGQVFTECYPLSTSTGSTAAPKSTGYSPAELRGGKVLWDVLAAAGVPDTVFTKLQLSHADSVAIVDGYLRDYSARIDYSDTLRVDTAGIKGYVAMRESLRFNRVQQRSWGYSLVLPVITNTVRVKPKKWGLGLQVGYGYSIGDKPRPYVGVGLSRNLLRFNL